MKKFKPFLNYTYFNKFEKSNNFSRFVCPNSFNVLSNKQSDLLTRNEHNVFSFKDDVNGASKIKNWIDDSVVVSNKQLAFYIYEMTYKISGNNYSLIGIVGALKLPEKNDDEYILSCEESLNDDVDFNFNFLKNCGFYSSPICAVYEDEDNNKILNIVKAKTVSSYIFKAKQNNVVHKIWRIDDEKTIDFLTEFFQDKVYYLLDGVEKYQAAIKYRDYLKENNLKTNFNDENYIMTLLFEKNSIPFTALPFHRLVSGLKMFDGEAILKESSENFDILKCKTLDSMRRTLFNFRREGKLAFGIYLDDCYSVLCLKDLEKFKELFEKFSEYKKFDFFVLNKLFFEDILKLNSDDLNSHLNYCCVDQTASDIVDEGDACFSVYLSALRSSEIFEFFKIDKKLLPKSYSFFPNPVEGLLFYIF